MTLTEPLSPSCPLDGLHVCRCGMRFGASPAASECVAYPAVLCTLLPRPGLCMCAAHCVCSFPAVCTLAMQCKGCGAACFCVEQ